ncbi:GNAT family N-acetyltransferase [Streptomyces sp. NPDC051243]|uniref:GNAT family N-acetyltransferase n=1 Tax=Streptomyces sp. NPDC051243 TaxID=3365646 RepID=UPI0037BD7CD6
MNPFVTATGGLAPGSWDRLVGPHLYQSSGWLDFCHADRPGHVGAVYTGGPQRPEAAVPVTAVRSMGNAFYQWHELLTARGLPGPGAQGLMVGQHWGYHTQLLHDAALSHDEAAAALLPELRRQAAAPATRDLVGIGAGDPVPCVAMYVDDRTVAAFRRAGVTAPPVLLQLEAWIPVPEGGWEGYLDSLGYKRSVRVRRDRRRFEEAGYRVEQLTLDECCEETGHLLACTQRRYGHAADAKAFAESFQDQARAMKGRTEVFLARAADGRPIGFCLYYVWGDSLFLRAAGFDYEALTGAAEYFNIVYYLPLQQASERGVRRMHAGIEASEAKALRGGRLGALWLLDLSEHSVLEGLDEQVAEANARTLRTLVGSSKTVAGALADPALAELL